MVELSLLNRQSNRLDIGKPFVLCVFPSDTLTASLKKGEVKERYFNPCNLFREIQVISLASNDIDPKKVQRMFGDANVEVHSVGPKSRLGKLFCRFSPDLYYLTRLPQLLSVVREAKPSVIRTYDPLLQGYLATYVGCRLGIPVVISVHGIWTHEKSILYRRILFWVYRNPVKALYDLFAILKVSTLDKLFERSSLRSASELICAYEYPKEYVSKYRHTIIPTIYNRVDTNKFNPVKRLRAHALTILHVGRLVFEKSPENLIRAIRDLPVKLIIVGNGDLRGYLNRLVHKLQSERKVQFIYRYDHKMIQRLYAKADIFVMCMKIGGVSIPILEAMASGLPILFTRGIYEKRKELIEGAGICVRDDPKEIRQTLSLLIGDRRLRERLGREVRKRILRMNGKKMERLEASLYRRLAKRL